MFWRNTEQRYGVVAQAAHWLVAVLVLGTFGLGLYMVSLELSPAKLRLYSVHKWIGVTVFGLAALRLAWRWYSPPPALPVQMQAWQRYAARGSHALLYLLLFAVPVSGWLMSSAKGFPTVYLGLWQLPDLVERNRELGDALARVHWVLNKLLLTLVTVHVAAALKHHFRDRDDILARMTPWLRAPRRERRR